ncbi:hypothetical protein [Sphingobium sp.]|uniref:hypothetical protein n=1 Tax=Sphingobium sp. TaxID=1912891 RepID=UPI0028BDA33A|nr:hypothetical protein [Sphingobium sp.]
MRVLTAICVLFPACAGAIPAQAAPASATAQVKGVIKGKCALPSAAPITFSTVVPANGKLDPALANLSWTISGLACNAGSAISISARSLRLNAPRGSLTPSQSQAVNYTATASGWSPGAATVTTGDTTSLGTTALYTGVAQSQAAPKSGTIIISVSNFTVSTNKGSSANSAKPVDGAYSATIILNLAPSI